MLPYTTVYGNRVYLMHSTNARTCRALAIASKCSYEQRDKRAQHDKDFQRGFVLPCVAGPYRLYTGVKIILSCSCDTTDFFHFTFHLFHFFGRGLSYHGRASTGGVLRKRLIKPQKASYARICNIKPDVTCKTLKREMKFTS